MAHDPVRVAEARGWFVKARGDLRAATVDMSAEPPLLEDALFHAQQAVEKTLKGFLAWHDRPARRTHNLVELGGLCAEIDVSLETLLRRVAPLSEYAWRYRYPGELGEPSASEAEEALALAGQVVEAVLGRVPGEVRP